MAVHLWMLAFIYQAGNVASMCNVTDCDTDYCNETNCTQCLPGYYQDVNTYEKCYLICNNCTGSECYEYVDDACESDSLTYPNCTAAECSENTTANCSQTGCPDGFYLSNSRCYRCNKSNCKCSDETGCDECLPGYYGPNDGGYRCNSTNCKCSSESGCDECIPGYYGINDGCSHQCPSNCISCTDSVNCTECQRGKFNNTCGSNCSSPCSDGTCHIELGTCECKTNQYQKNLTCLDCQPRCASCVDFGNCTACNKFYYWGVMCQYDCTGCYFSCNRTNGCSTGCDTIYYQNYSIPKLGYECIHCPNACATCNGSDTCTSCQNNTWGPVCQFSCDNCGSGCDMTIGCGQNCTGGYYPVSIDIGNECKPCSDNCSRCKNSSLCTVCDDGYYVDEIKQCSSCSFSCIDTKCSTTNGTCTLGCKPGQTGDRCDEECLVNCKECDQFNLTYCHSCENGLYGDSCEMNCSLSCKRENGSLKCDKDDGTCLNGCEAGYWSDQCSENCSERCMEQKCNETSGYCMSGCQDGWYGANCSLECIEGCNRCFQENGTCELGCTYETSGGHCTDETTSKTEITTQGKQDTETRDDPDETGGDSIAVTAGAGAGAAAILILVGIMVLLVLRRRSRRKLKTHNEEGFANEMYNMHYTGPLDGEPGTAAINDHSAATDTPDSKGSCSRQNPYEGHTIGDPQANIPTPETNSETGNDQKLAHLSTEVNGLKDGGSYEGRTYYNTVGRRVKVSELADYVASKSYDDIEEEFENLPTGLLKACSVAKSATNAVKNRYKMIYPYDESRVVLQDGGNDYVNASYIEGFHKPKEYIASAGPFKREDRIETTTDFWRMIWQEKCETIVMLTKCFENMEQKCEQYWPDLGDAKMYGNVHVTCIAEDHYADFTVRSFVSKQDKTTYHNITRQIHFSAWPDKGVPDDVTCLIECRQKVRRLHGDRKSPIIVHCSAGIGRTGTFIALDILTFMGEAMGYVDIFGCVTNLRQQRVNMVQTTDQYDYLHEAVLHALTFESKPIPAKEFITYYSTVIQQKDGTSPLETQFKKLNTAFEVLLLEDEEAIGRNKTLTDKNRAGADIPSDQHRVRLFDTRTESSDYINAVLMNGYKTCNKFIVAQTPLSTTVVDFLSLIYESESSCVVSMDDFDLQEKHTEGVFWPEDKEVVSHGIFQIACKESKSNESYTLKKCSIVRNAEKIDEEREICLFMFTNWPRTVAVPRSSDSLLQLIKDVDMANNNREHGGRPIIVHCMTGAERSCLYCAVSVLIEKVSIENEVSVVNTVRQIKSRRRSAFPTLGQYKFCYQAVVNYIQTSDFTVQSGSSQDAAADDVYATVIK